MLKFEDSLPDCESSGDIQKYYTIAGNRSQLSKVPIMPNCETHIWNFGDWFEDHTLEESENPEVIAILKPLDEKVCS